MSSNLAPAAELTILIPAFDEEASLGQVLDELLAEPRLRGAEITVIDDGSSDRTAEVARAAGARVLRNARNLGYGAALKRGLGSGCRRYLAWFDADGQHRPADLADMFEDIVRSQADAVFGSRTPESAGVKSRAPGKALLHLAVVCALGHSIPDANCGLRVFRSAVLHRYVHLLPNGFSASTTTTLLFLKRNYDVHFHPIRANSRRGVSSVRQVRDGWRTLHTIVRTQVLFNAFQSFSVVAAGLFVVGSVYGIATALVRGQGFPVLAALVILLAAQVFCMGILCDQISAIRIDKLEESRSDDGPCPPGEGR